MNIEVWKWIPRYKEYYKGSNYGRIKAVARYVKHPRGGVKYLREKILKPTLHKRSGYFIVRLSKNGKSKWFQVHTLILNTFAGPCPEGMQCRHLNDIRTENIWPKNIRWGTPSQNHRDAFRNGGRVQHGEKNPGHKLQSFQVRRIKIRYKHWKGSKDKFCKHYGETFDVSTRTIYDIVNNKTWSHI
jgi:hypothetical protein